MSNIASAVKHIREWVAAGRPRMEWMGSNLPAARNAVVKALEIETDFFWRGTNRAEEIQDVKNGVQIISKNYVNNTMEGGMSVCDSLATVWAYNYKFAYKCVGDVCDAGSDGEPVIVNARPISELYDAQRAKMK